MPPNADAPDGSRPRPQRADLLERDERLQSLGLLAGAIAHDFNNLLAPILGYSTLIKEEFAPDSSGLQFAQSMETAARRAERNIEQTLLATRPQRRFSPRSLEFDKMVVSEVEKWRQELPANSAITVEIDCAPATLMADEYHWRVAVRHLLNNARYGCATGGVVRVTLENVRLDAGKVAELGLPQADVIRLRVADNGNGISAEALARAYDPFFTTRTKGAAPGLGLTACHSISYLHGGQIELSSQPDAGTEVTIWLPQHFLAGMAPLPMLQNVGRPALSAPTPRKRVLLLADDPLEREVLKAALVRRGYETLTPEDRAAGWRLFERLNRDFIFVLASFLDVSANDLKWLHQMQELNGQVPIHFVTNAEPDRLGREMAAQNLTLHVHRKPLRLSQVLAGLPR
jgi:hypothetical protein